MEPYWMKRLSKLSAANDYRHPANGTPLLHRLAADATFSNLAWFLRECKPNVNVLDLCGRTALFRCACDANVQMLIDAGINIHITALDYPYSRSAVEYFARWHKPLDLVFYLLDRGANPQKALDAYQKRIMVNSEDEQLIEGYVCRRRRCLVVVLALLATMRRGSASILSKDMIRLLARRIWATRTHEKWTAIKGLCH